MSCPEIGFLQRDDFISIEPKKRIFDDFTKAEGLFLNALHQVVREFFALMSEEIFGGGHIWVAASPSDLVMSGKYSDRGRWDARDLPL